MAVLYFGASHVTRAIYMLPDGEYCLADGSLYGQQPIDEYHSRYDCWACGGVGFVKVYLGRGYELAACDVCRMSKESSLMPPLRPRHVHDWRAVEEKAAPLYEPHRCPCGALWLKKQPQKSTGGRIAGLLSVGELLKAKGGPDGRNEQE